jgi:hypothetical protein
LVGTPNILPKGFEVLTAVVMKSTIFWDITGDTYAFETIRKS